jgi:hypothetical protein
MERNRLHFLSLDDADRRKDQSAVNVEAHPLRPRIGVGLTSDAMRTVRSKCELVAKAIEAMFAQVAAQRHHSDAAQ